MQVSLGCAVDAWLGLKQALGAPLIVKKAPTLRTQAPALDSRVLFTAVRRTTTVALRCPLVGRASARYEASRGLFVLTVLWHNGARFVGGLVKRYELRCCIRGWLQSGSWADAGR